jgi:hypothetical protein
LTKNSQSETLSKLGFSAYHENEAQSRRLDLQYFYAGEETAHYLNLREAYTSWTLKSEGSSDIQVSVGRKIKSWSVADQVWQQGVWQPRFMWSRVRPEQNGLTGLFFDAKRSNWAISALVSPVYIPEMGPQFKFRNNRITSANPWFLAPASSATVEGLFENREIIYEINQPEISDIVLQNSAVLNLRWQDQEKFCHSSFAYKPLNGILNSVELQLRIDLPTAPPGVEVYPYTDYQRLLSLECGWESREGLYGFVSAGQDSPLQSARPSQWVTKRLDDSQILSGLVGYRWSNKEVYLTSWRLTGGESLDSGDRASSESSFFGDWYDYKNAFRLAYKEMKHWKAQKILWEAGLTWEAEQEGWVWTSSFELQTRKNINIFARWDSLNLIEGSRSLGQSEFINNFKSNDLASLGVSFVY